MKIRPRLIHSQVTLYVLISFLQCLTISTTIKINSSVEETPAHWVVGVQLEWFLFIFNDCFCSTVIEDGEKPFYLLSNSLYPLRFFVQIMNDYIGTRRILYCLNKETSFLKFTLNSLLGDDFHLTQHRNSACWNTKIFREGLFCNPCPYRDMDWLPYRWMEPICIFNKNRVEGVGVLS
jgi:hypothetical protein